MLSIQRQGDKPPLLSFLFQDEILGMDEQSKKKPKKKSNFQSLPPPYDGIRMLWRLARFPGDKYDAVQRYYVASPMMDFRGDYLIY